MQRSITFLLLIATLLVGFAPAQTFAQGDQAALTKALDWIRTQQNADGSFNGFGPGDTADVIVAFAAAEVDPTSLAQGKNTPLSYLETQAGSYAATSIGATAKLILAAVAAGADPTNFGGENLLVTLGEGYDAASGQYGADVFSHALAILAIRSVGATPPTPAIDWLISQQLDDSGWSFDGSVATGSDTNTTSLAIQALKGEAKASTLLANARGYLQSQQNADGGFPYSQASSFGTDSDANSTAAVIQALLALGDDPDGSAWAKGGKTPFAALLALQNASGALRYQAAQTDDNALATYQAATVLAGKFLPVATAQISGAQAYIAVRATPRISDTPTNLPTTGVGAASENLPITLGLAGLLIALAGMTLRLRSVRR